VQGGSRSILKPLPPVPTPEEVSAAAKASRTAVTGGGRPARGGREAAAGPTVSRRYLAGLREALQDYMDVWHQQQPVDPTLALCETTTPWPSPAAVTGTAARCDPCAACWSTT
jgi:hypothetical protein